MASDWRKGVNIEEKENPVNTIKRMSCMFPYQIRVGKGGECREGKTLHQSPKVLVVEDRRWRTSG